MKKVKGKTYTISYDETTASLAFQGVLRLESMEEGEPVTEFLNQVAETAPETVRLDFEQLQVMNSTGLSILTKFMIKMRDQNTSKVILRASDKHFWQRDLITGLQRFMPESELQWV